MDFVDILQKAIIFAPALLIAIIMHEVAHGYVAYKLGDPTAKMMGRLTLNPIPHIDPFGTIILPLLLYIATNGQFAFGSAKPVPINAMNFKNPRRDMAISAASGPVTNLLLAAVSVILFKHIIMPLSVIAPSSTVLSVLKPLALILNASIFINVVLAVINMIPIPPLDGGRVMMGILPYRQAMTLGRIEPFGIILVMVLLFATGLSSYILAPVIFSIINLLSLL